MPYVYLRRLFSGIALALSASVPSSLLAQAALPAAAQEAVDKGVTAAQKQEYPLAIRFFQEARKLAPEAPVVLFNLGVAESRIPGRELRAIAWFGAYLESSPFAPNAAAVRSHIQTLDARHQVILTRLIVGVQEAANELLRLYPGGSPPGDTQPWNPQANPHYVLADLSARAGDIAAALKWTAMIRDAGRQDQAYRRIAVTQAEAGDSAGAVKTAGLIRNAIEKAFAYRDIAEAQIGNGNVTEALETARLIPNTDVRKIYAYRSIAMAQAEVGDMAGARKTTALMLANIDSIRDQDEERPAALGAIVQAQAKVGDIAGAQKSAKLIRDATVLARSLPYIGEAQGVAGNAAEARKSFAAALHADGHAYTQRLVSMAQMRSGDLAGAQETADRILESVDKVVALTSLARIQVKEGDVAGAQKTLASAEKASGGSEYLLYLIAQVQRTNVWLRALDDDNSEGWSACPLNSRLFMDTAEFLTSQGKVKFDNPEVAFRYLHENVRKIVVAHNALAGMLKKQASQAAKK